MTRVLVVDDNEPNLYLLQKLLEGKGCEVSVARHGGQALELARKNPPNMVVSDLFMPVLDGYALLRQWRADERLKAIPFVVYTATYTEPKDERLALALGADAFMIKPAEPEVLMARIQEVLDNTKLKGPVAGRKIEDSALVQAYTEVLFHKLEKKALQLEETNRELVEEIAQKKRAEAALLENEEQLRKVQKLEAIGQLAAGVAHDFNNILAAILGNADLLLADAKQNPVRQSLEEIKKAGIRGKSLVRQILSFSQQLPQERLVIDLGPVLEEAVALLRAIIPSSVDLVLTVDSATPPVLADPTQVHQVVVNLCTNAWHALEEKPGRVDLRLEPVTPDAILLAGLAGMKPGPTACLSVTDNGHGMDGETLGHIFEPFFTTRRQRGGAGLGLAVAHGIVRAHDGAITVDTKPGEGTTFRVYFPASISAPAPATPTLPLRHGEGQHILFIDDEEQLGFLASRMFAKLGYQATTFTRASEASIAFRRDPSRFDVVITDLNMPGASGLEVAEDLLKIRPDMPVLLTSGHVTEDLKRQAKSLGIREVLYKPNTMGEYAAAIQAYLSEPH